MRYGVPVAATIPVRLPPDLLRKLDAWAVTLGVSRSAAIKLCLAQQMGVIETASASQLAALDGRAYRYQVKVAGGSQHASHGGTISINGPKPRKRAPK